MLQIPTQEPWWTTDTYDLDATLLTPEPLAGPRGVATVYVLPDGRTQAGWGLKGKDGKPGFMEKYRRGDFNQRVTDHRYNAKGEPFAYVMRSLQLVCIDVDGKNGGYSNMPALGDLPPTLAETSKSGNGLHLFYRTHEEWDDEEGFARFDDRIGLVTGIDVRATGCVYHHNTQRWNRRHIAELPAFLENKLQEAKERRVAAAAALANMEDMDMDDVIIAQHALLEELKKPIPSGKRNNTLFGIGSKLKTAGVPGWEAKVYDRGIEIGLDHDEVQKLVDNIAAYAG